MKKIHAIVFNWPGQTHKAEEIVRLVAPAVDRLDVVNSDEAADRDGWVNVGNDAYYGKQFQKALEIFEGDILLQIQADASCADWPQLVGRARQLFEQDARVGIVAPAVDYTAWDTPTVELMQVSDTLSLVVVTDCIVWSMDRRVAEFLRAQPLHRVPLGYGIDWIASVYCFRNGLLVMRDSSIQVLHPRGTGSYPIDLAHQQMYEMLNDMDLGDRQLFALLTAYPSYRRAIGLAAPQ